MKTVMKRVGAVLAATIALAALGATTARAGDSNGVTDPQLVDVSKQVSEIQKKMNELLAQGKTARAGKLLSGADCDYGDPSTVFSPWGDFALYALAPQGDLSQSDGWTLNKATVVDGGDPFTGAGQSLEFVNSAEAVTPAMCVNLDNPALRFFARDVGGNGKSNLKVDMLYEDFDGHVKHMTIARLKAGQDWQPTLILPIYMNMLAAASSTGVTAIALDFKAEGIQKDETIDVSGIYVDPFCSR
jgi:hypothetical protein